MTEKWILSGFLSGFLTSYKGFLNLRLPSNYTFESLIITNATENLKMYLEILNHKTSCFEQFPNTT